MEPFVRQRQALSLADAPCERSSRAQLGDCLAPSVVIGFLRGSGETRPLLCRCLTRVFCETGWRMGPVASCYSQACDIAACATLTASAREQAFRNLLEWLPKTQAVPGADPVLLSPEPPAEPLWRSR